MRAHGMVQDGLYGRLIDRLAEVGAVGEIEGIREYWAELAAASDAAKAAAARPPPESPAAALVLKRTVRQ